jgi:mannitol/fructose-specific phosphotransferase system IIA component
MSEVLQKKNIFLNCEPQKKEEVIKKMGQVLVDSGYVDESYIQAMLEKEKVFNTAIGNEIAIPHGIEASKESIKKSGIGIMVFPKGTDWDGQKVRVVIGIAGVGDEHLDILASIAMNLTDTDDIDNLVKSDVDTIYNMFAA